LIALRNVMFLCLALSSFAAAQSSASLLATTDLDCNWKLDGKPQDLLKVDDSIVVAASAGKHLVQATSTDGLTTFRLVEEASQGQEMVEIKMKSYHQGQIADADRAQHPTWTAPATRLMWVRDDNGSAVTWQQASNYYANLQLGGYSGWRLPVINELAGTYDETQNYQGVHIKGGIHNWFAWSNSAGDASGVAWYFNFLDGKRVSFQLGGSGIGGRALCVRRSGE